MTKMDRDSKSVPLKAVCYARVSTGRQEKEETIKSQLDSIRKRIKQDGNVLVHNGEFVDDGWTGEILERPGLDGLRDAVVKNGVEAVYVYDRGRLARKFSYQEIVIEELEEKGLKFVTLHDMPADTPEQKVMQAMQGVFHEYERVKIAERMRRGKMFKVKSGKLLGYNPSYGYDYVPKTKTREGYFRINKKEAEAVRKIFNWIGNEGQSIRWVIKRLHELNIPPKKQKRDIWTKGPLLRLLKNETYIGKHYYNKSRAVVGRRKDNGEGSKYKKIKKNSRVVRPREEWLMIKAPRIVSDEVFNKVQKQLELNKKYARRNTRHEYLLQGLIYCPCGCRRTGEKTSKHLYYRCTDRLHCYPLSRKCFSQGVNATVVDVTVWKGLRNYLSSPELIRKHLKRWLRSKKSSADENELSKLKQEQLALTEEENRYAKAYGEGIMSLEVYKKRIGDVKRKRKGIEVQIKAIKKSSKGLGVVLKENLEALVKKVQKVISSLNLTDKKYVVRKILEKVVVDRESVTMYGYLPITQESYIDLSYGHRDCWNVRLPFLLQCKLLKDQKARVITGRNSLGRIISATQVPANF